LIKYELKCSGCAHQFEGWFADSATYDVQEQAGEILCPVCGSADVGKAIMAPNIAIRENRQERPASAHQIKAEVRRALAEIRRDVESNFDYVGSDFADEARRIHNGEAKKRGIYGNASREDAKDLRDEGIEVMTIPWVPSSDA